MSLMSQEQRDEMIASKNQMLKDKYKVGDSVSHPITMCSDGSMPRVTTGFGDSCPGSFKQHIWRSATIIKVEEKPKFGGTGPMAVYLTIKYDKPMPYGDDYIEREISAELSGLIKGVKNTDIIPRNKLIKTDKQLYLVIGIGAVLLYLYMNRKNR
jgi:hypothetical protein